MPRYFIVFIIMDKDQDEDDLPEAVGDENQDDGYYHHCYKYHYGDENQDKDASHWLQARDAVKSLRNALGDENQVKDDYYHYYYSRHSYKKRYSGYKAKRYYGYHAKRYYGYHAKRYGHSHYYGHRYSHHTKHVTYAKLCYRYYYYYYGDAHQVNDDYVYGQKCYKYFFGNKYNGDENQDD